MKNLVLFIDNESNSTRTADVLRRYDNRFRYERYSDYTTAFKRIIRNNFDTMIANLNLEKQCNVTALVRANYNIGKSTIVLYSGLWQQISFALSNLDIIDSITFIPLKHLDKEFANTVKKLSMRPPVPFAEIFQRYI
jgi:hypothetical protein